VTQLLYGSCCALCFISWVTLAICTCAAARFCLLGICSKHAAVRVMDVLHAWKLVVICGVNTRLGFGSQVYPMLFASVVCAELCFASFVPLASVRVAGFAEFQGHTVLYLVKISCQPSWD